MQTLLAAGWRGALHGGARRIERRGAVRSATRVRGRVSSGVVPITSPEARVYWLAGWLAGAPCPGRCIPRLPQWNAALCALFNRPL